MAAQKEVGAGEVEGVMVSEGEAEGDEEVVDAVVEDVMQGAVRWRKQVGKVDV